MASLAAKIKAARTVNGGVETYESGKEFVALIISAERVRSGRKQYLVKWKDYDHTYDTWEDSEDVGASYIDVYNEAVHGIRHELSMISDETVQKVVSLKEEKGAVEVPIPAIHGEAAHRVLRHLSRPPSRVGQEPLPIETKTIGGRRRSFVTLNALEDIAWALQFHTVRPDKAYGALLYAKGGAQDNDMLFFGPEFVAEYDEPKPRGDGFFVAGARTFTVKGNVWRILGNTGEVRGEIGMPNATFCKPIGEHVKNLLRGRKAWGLKHQLTDTWAQLPAGTMELVGAAAFARRVPKKRQRAAPEKPVAPPLFG